MLPGNGHISWCKIIVGKKEKRPIFFGKIKIYTEKHQGRRGLFE